MKVLQVTVPHGQSFSKIVRMFRRAGCEVDDLGSVTSEGRLIDVWIPPEQLMEKSLDQRRGFFLGELGEKV